MLIKDMIAGSLLGDSCITLSRAGTPRLRMRHSVHQKEYLMHKYGILKEICPSAPKSEINSGFGTELWFFQTSCIGWLQELYEDFYPDGKKQLTERIAKYLSPIALAYWYMDDGSRSLNTATISTHGFLREQQHFLRDLIKEKYGLEIIEATEKRKNLYYMRMRKSEAQQFFNLIGEFVPACNCAWWRRRVSPRGRW